MSLEFYESFQKYDIPENLKDELYNADGQKLTLINNLNKINIFVGPNNSGKSKIIREILRTETKMYYSDHQWNNIKAVLTEFLDDLLKNLRIFFIRYNPGDYQLHMHSGPNILSLTEIIETKNIIINHESNFNISALLDLYKENFKKWKLVQANYYLKINDKNTRQVELSEVTKVFEMLEAFKIKFDLLISYLERYKFSLYNLDFSRIYIPSIRTLRGFAQASNIEASTRREYTFVDKIQIFNGQSVPVEIFDLTTSEYSKRQKLQNFQMFLSEYFFESQKVELTYHQKNQVLLIKIGEETERPIQDLGDGLQMIIILTYPFFLNEAGIIAIEEPELFIHPGLQKLFIRFLLDNPIAKNFQVFIASHSNHIIDSINFSDKISLFGVRKKIKADDNSVEKAPDFVLENLAHGHESLLNLLGITSTSVYLSNCTIWVEGITDRIYLQSYINAYLKQEQLISKYKSCRDFQEGINYSFSLTAGDSIIHWDFSDSAEYESALSNIIVRKFCSKAMIIIDNDFAKNSGRKDKLKNLLGDRLLELELPEIENLLSESVIKNTIMEYPSVSNKISQVDELPNLDAQIFKENKVGKIIDKHLLNSLNGVKTFEDPKSESGSLKPTDKVEFCKKTLKYISFETMTKESKFLVERVLDFIISNNKK